MKSKSHHVRIIGGSLRGSRIEVLDRPGLRPTPDRARETLFNWLAPVLSGSRVLDLFAGTGVLGIEALSRGAGKADFVESDPAIAAALRATLTRLKQQATVLARPAREALALLPGPYDLVFVDPPFAGELWTETLGHLEASARLSPSAWIHVESPAGAELQVPTGWAPWREGRFGEVMLHIYRRTPETTIS